MTAATAVHIARDYFESGAFALDLARRVAIPTESQRPDSAAHLHGYLVDEIQRSFEALGFTCRLLERSDAGPGHFLYAERIEDPALLTLLTYGHGDVVLGMEGRWREGRSPWTLDRDGDRFYGRGTADNKGQHTINMGALGAVLRARGRLGFNAKAIIEMGEETGSPGLREVCTDHRALLRADVFIASDGPRVRPERPTIFLGSRGSINMNLTVELREGAHHSGNWGGALANPGIVLAHALASITTATGEIRIPEWRPPAVSDTVRGLLHDLELGGTDDSPTVDPDWGEPGLSPVERVYGWNSFEVLAFSTGSVERPVNAIPAVARATVQLRFVVGIEADDVIPALRRHLDAHGFGMVHLAPAREAFMRATRLDVANPWVGWTVASIARTTGKDPAVLPNLGGSIPNDIFTDVLGLLTVWVPHSYPACAQHTVDEHLLASVAREGLEMMAGIFWDLGEGHTPHAGV